MEGFGDGNSEVVKHLNYVKIISEFNINELWHVYATISATVQKETLLTDGVFCTWLSVGTLCCKIDNAPLVHHIGVGEWAVGAGRVEPPVVLGEFVSVSNELQSPFEVGNIKIDTFPFAQTDAQFRRDQLSAEE